MRVNMWVTDLPFSSNVQRISRQRCLSAPHGVETYSILHEPQALS